MIRIQGPPNQPVPDSPQISTYAIFVVIDVKLCMVNCAISVILRL